MLPEDGRVVSNFITAALSGDDITPSRSLLGWSPRVMLADGLARTTR